MGTYLTIMLAEDKKTRQQRLAEFRQQQRDKNDHTVQICKHKIITYSH